MENKISKVKGVHILEGDGVFGWDCFSSIIRYDYDLSFFFFFS